MILHPSLESILTWLKFPIEIADCYQLLGLRYGASVAEINASYQQLTQQYNPDINLFDQKAKDKFIAVTEAYKILVSVVEADQINNKQSGFKPSMSQGTQTQGQQLTTTKVKGNQTTIRNQPPLSEFEEQLKWLSYYKLQQFLKYQQFPKAIALVEGLAQRLPYDPQVSQWQAIAYQRWGRQLLNERQLKKARIYLKKALKTDPHNRDLWFEVEQDFRRLEQMF